MVVGFVSQPELRFKFNSLFDETNIFFSLLAKYRSIEIKSVVVVVTYVAFQLTTKRNDFVIETFKNMTVTLSQPRLNYTVVIVNHFVCLNFVKHYFSFN